MDIQIIPKKILRALLFCIGILILLHSIAVIGKFGFNHPFKKGFPPLSIWKWKIIFPRFIHRWSFYFVRWFYF